MKKLIPIIALVAAVLIPATVAAEPTLMEGDANLDGNTNIIDAMVVAQYTVDPNGSAGILCVENWSQDNSTAGDVNDDGKCNIIDAMILAQYTVDPDQSAGVLCMPLWDPVADADMLPPNAP